MTSRSHKRKLPQGLHNHDERPFLTRRITVDHSAVSFSQSAISGPIPEEVYGPQYAIPTDEDGRYEIELDDTDVFPRITPEILSGGVPGIKVIPKVKAKRYANSVSRSSFFIMADMLTCLIVRIHHYCNG